eukprot:GHVT01025817.1.p1 GENE.GHVT01025817.1~~GHVT01025817.1.p1  ORF type:complete len:182 (+),score=36.12 GHVT01025817.1:136-681(+)
MEPAKAWSPRTVRRVFLLGVAVGLLAMLVVTIALWALLRLRRAFCPRFGAPCVAALSRTMAKFLLKLKSCAKGAETSRPLQNARDEESPDGGRANDNGLAFTPGGRRSQAAEVPLKTGQYDALLRNTRPHYSHGISAPRDAAFGAAAHHCRRGCVIRHLQAIRDSGMQPACTQLAKYFHLL